MKQIPKIKKYGKVVFSIYKEMYDDTPLYLVAVLGRENNKRFRELLRGVENEVGNLSPNSLETIFNTEGGYLTDVNEIVYNVDIMPNYHPMKIHIPLDGGNVFVTSNRMIR